MDFTHSEKVRELQARVQEFMEAHVYPAEAAHAAEVQENRSRGNPWIPTAAIEGAQAAREGAGTLEPLAAAVRVRRGSHEPGVRATLRDHGPIGDRPRGLQLLGARHGQHGGAGSLRHGGAEAHVARAAPRRDDPLGVRDDRAGGRLVGCHQHRVAHRAPRRRVRAQRPEVVDLGRGRSALRDPDLHGQERRRARGSPPTAVDDTRAARHRRCHGRAAAAGVRLRRCTARTLGGGLQGRPRACFEHAAGRGPRLRDRAGAARPRPDPPLHAPDRRLGTRARGVVPARHCTRPHSAARCRSRASLARGSPRRGS